MSLPALASLSDLEARMGATSDSARAQAALDDASALIRAEARTTWVDGDGDLYLVPDVIVTLTLKVARRALRNPDGLSAEAAGPFSVSYSGGEVYLTGAEKDIIASSVSVAPIGSMRMSAPWTYYDPTSS